MDGTSATTYQRQVRRLDLFLLSMESRPLEESLVKGMARRGLKLAGRDECVARGRIPPASERWPSPGPSLLV